VTRAAAITAALALIAASAPAVAQHTLEIIEENGPADNRIDLVLMGDGYTAAQQGELVTNTDSALEHVLDSELFTRYRTLFNFARIATVSNESGADHPAESAYVDTYFNCSYDCYGIGHLICCDEATVLAVAAEVYPEFDLILVVVNDSQYGGSGGAIAITSASIWAQDIPRHEFGHTIGGLGDEYDDVYPSWECQDLYPNVSPTYDAGELKWSHWVEDGTPLPTPDSAVTGDLEPVGAYEGACYEPEDWYRPVWSCLMRDLDSDFCPVCAEALVLSFYGYVDPIDEYEPAETELVGAPDDVIEFSVTSVEPDPDTVELTWRVDGAEVEGGDDGFLDLDLAPLFAGEHQVEVTARDTTELVRSDPEGATEQTVSWQVTREPGTAGAPDGSTAGQQTFAASSPGGCSCASPGSPVPLASTLAALLVRAIIG